MPEAKVLTGALVAAAFISSGVADRSAAVGSTLRTAAQTAPARWPERVLVREGPTVSSQAFSGGALYALISRTHTPMRGPYRLERTDLRTGAVREGPTFSLGNVAIAAGRLWLSGASGGQLRLIEVDPHSLTPIRSIPLPGASASYPHASVAAGPGGSIWIGGGRTLLRVDVVTGAKLLRLLVPPRLAIGDLAVDPGRRHLYVSLAHVVRGGIEGAIVLEFDARSGRELAHASTGLITYSVAGAGLTAVPGGVWASFRTGLLGLTIHLRQRDLAMIAPPGRGIAQQPATGLFHWPMSATSLYRGGALWLANESGIVACLNPRAGTVRASERVSLERTPDLLAADTPTHRLLGLEGSRLIELLPPRRCWS